MGNYQDFDSDYRFEPHAYIPAPMVFPPCPTPAQWAALNYQEDSLD